MDENTRDKATVYRADPVWDIDRPWWKVPAEDLERLYVDTWEIDIHDKARHHAHIRAQYNFPIVIVSI